MTEDKKYKTGCLICGKELVYLKKDEKIRCNYCQNFYDSNVKCIDNHYICDSCHSLSANDLIEKTCIKSKSENPLELAMMLMKNPNIKMHGPEHHFLVPAVLLTSYYNIKKEYHKKKEKIKKARKRAEQTFGGFCGTHGTCSGAIGTGIFISIITDATPLSEKEWKLSNQMTAKTLSKVAEYGGPRCCKRNTFIAIIEAVNFLKNRFNENIKIDRDVLCTFSDLNNECIQDQCPFHN